MAVMKPVRASISLVADVCGILAFVGLSATGLVAWSERRHTFSWPLIGSLFVSFVVSPAIAYFVLKNISPRVGDYRRRRLFRAPKELKLTATELTEILVGNDRLERTFNRLEKHARSWDESAVITEILFYQEIDSRGSFYTMAIEVYSAWRRAKVEFSVMTDITGSVDQVGIRERAGVFRAMDPIPAGQPFFKVLAQWHEEVVRQYGPMELGSREYLYVNVSTAKRQAPKIKLTDESTDKHVLAPTSKR